MDKFGFDHDQLVAFVRAVGNYADAKNKGYIKYEDLHRVLIEEQGLEW